HNDLEVAPPAALDPRHDLIALNAALTKLGAEDPQAAKLVKLRHFMGLSVAEAAHALGISPHTADRGRAIARTWLPWNSLTQQPLPKRKHVACFWDGVAL